MVKLTQSSEAVKHGINIFNTESKKVEIFNFQEIYDVKKHPITGVEFTPKQIQYISYMHRIYLLLNTNKISINESICHYVEFLLGNTEINKFNSDRLEIIKACVEPHHLYSHFREFKVDPSEESLRKERLCAEKELKLRMTGSWLLRHSSHNRRPIETDISAEKWTNDNKVQGIIYYAFSIVEQNETTKFMHSLIKYTPGVGWETVSIKSDKTQKFVWYPTFMSLLEYLLYVNKTKFVNLCKYVYANE